MNRHTIPIYIINISILIICMLSLLCSINAEAAKKQVFYMTVGDVMPIPLDVNNGNYFYHSSNLNALIFDDAGRMVAKKSGNADVILTYNDKNDKIKKVRFKVKIHAKVKKIKWSRKTKSLKTGAIYSYKVNYKVKSKKNIALKWTSSDTDVAVVDSKGNVRAVGEGETMIKCSVMGQLKKTVSTKLNVTDIPVKRINVESSSLTLQLNDKYNLSGRVSVSPDNASDKSYDVSSDNKTIVKVDDDVLYAVGVGKTVITINAADGYGAMQTISVNVTDHTVNQEDVQTEDSNNDANNKTNVDNNISDKSNTKNSATVNTLDVVKKTDARFIAHRGLSSEAPENTIKAFELAGQKGFYGSECDVWLTNDEQFVISHDGNINRMCGVDKNIYDMLLEDIRSYKITNGANIEKYKDDVSATTIPTLTEYLDVCKQYSMVPVIEIKFAAGSDESDQDNPLYRMYQEIEEVMGENQVFIISFYYDSIKNMNEILKAQECSTISLLLLLGQCNDVQDIHGFDYCKENNIGFDMLYSSSSALITELTSQGIAVGAWTIDDASIAKTVIDNGAGYITSNVIVWQ